MRFTGWLLCSDARCAERIEVVGTLEELDSLSCECGSGLLVMAWPVPFED